MIIGIRGDLASIGHAETGLRREVKVEPSRVASHLPCQGLDCVRPAGPRWAYQEMLHWYGSAININPALFNVFVAAYERLRDRGVPLAGEAIEEFEVSFGL